MKVAIIQLSNDEFGRRRRNCSLPASRLNMHNFFPPGYFIECPRPEFGNTFQERLLASQNKKSHNFNLTYLVHFNVLFYLRRLKALVFCNLRAHRLNGCRWNSRPIRRLPDRFHPAAVQWRRWRMRVLFRAFKTRSAKRPPD